MRVANFLIAMRTRCLLPSHGGGSLMALGCIPPRQQHAEEDKEEVE